MFADRNTSKIGSIVLVVALAVSALGVAFSGGAVAQSDTTELVGDSFSPSNTTQSAYVDITGVSDMNGSGPVSVDVTYEGLAEGESVGNGTVLNTETVSVSEGAISSSTYSLADSDSDFDRIKVNAETAGDSTLIDSTEWGTVEQVAGGGGILSGSGGLSVPVLVALGAGVLLLMGRD